MTGEFPSQTASNAENVSILWHHHDGVHTTHKGIVMRSFDAFFDVSLKNCLVDSGFAGNLTRPHDAQVTSL